MPDNFKIADCQPEYVVIKPEATPEKSESGTIIIPDLVRESMNKLQNRGTVIYVGSKVEWPEVGKFVSFYRAAATPIITRDGEALVINSQHVLATLEQI